MKLSTDKAVVLFSGGQDSTTCLFWAIERFEKVYPLIISYQQRHSIEIAQAKIIAAFASTPFHVLETHLGQHFASNALTDTTLDVETTTPKPDELPNTFVPGRNLMFLTLAGMYAYQVGAANIVTGVNQADASGYPDCRADFVTSAQQSLSMAMDQQLQIHTPLMDKTKADIWLMARDLGCLDVVIRDSHTCYNGVRTKEHAWGKGCGECVACQLRSQGYKAAFG